MTSPFFKGFLLLSAILFVWLLTLPMVNRSPHNGRRTICQSHLKQLGLAFAQYRQDYDERFPPARVTSSTGWADVLLPYVKTSELFHCPTAENATTEGTDYFYNRRMVQRTLDKVTLPYSTVLLGDGRDNAPTWVSISHLPSAWTNTSEPWTKTPQSPSRRHLDTANYTFVDGHVKSLKATAVLRYPHRNSRRPTF